jgi:hypothetical protein
MIRRMSAENPLWGAPRTFLVYPLDFVGHYASARLYAAIIGSAAERRAIR